MLNYVRIHPRALVGDVEGATAIEYVLIAAFLAVSIILAIQNVGIALKGNYNTISSSVAAA
jgi:Flp pilus assembly pilin Flp